MNNQRFGSTFFLEWTNAFIFSNINYIYFPIIQQYPRPDTVIHNGSFRVSPYHKYMLNHPLMIIKFYMYSLKCLKIIICIIILPR